MQAVEATFVTLNGDVVVLEKKNGDRVRVPLGKLSAADRKWIRNADKSSLRRAARRRDHRVRALRRACTRLHGEQPAWYQDGGARRPRQVPRIGTFPGIRYDLPQGRVMNSLPAGRRTCPWSPYGRSKITGAFPALGCVRLAAHGRRGGRVPETSRCLM